MPTYLYNCPTCGDFEEFQRISDAKLEVCPKCGGKVEKKMHSDYKIRMDDWKNRQTGKRYT